MKMRCYAENLPSELQTKLQKHIDFVVSSEVDFDCIILYCNNWEHQQKRRLAALVKQYSSFPLLVILPQFHNEIHQLDILKAGASDCCCTSSHELISIKLQKLITNANTLKELNHKQTQVDEVLMRIAQEESFARHVYEEITGGALNHQKDYFSMQQSADGFCGDFIFEMVSPTGIRYLFLADAMGHGLAAALSIMPVIHVVKAMAHRSMPITTILQEVNRRLNTELPDDRFVTLAALEISPFSQTMSVVNAGLPDIFVLTKEGKLQTCSSHCIPLGIAEGAAFSFEPYTFKLSDLSRLFMFTDGLIEQQNASGVTIGKQGLLDILTNYTETQTEWDNVANLFDQHRGNEPLSDDVTLCAIDFSTFSVADVSSIRKEDARVGKISFMLDVNGEYLKSVDVPAFVSKFLYASGIEGKIAGKTFTAVAELYQNSLDHGVLNLNSELKNDIEGFAEYIQKREERMAALSLNDNIMLSVSYQANAGIMAEITDSGKGYDRSKVNPSQYSAHGRGLALVRQLSTAFETNDVGNQVSIVLKE